jgi:hypothetical protein
MSGQLHALAILLRGKSPRYPLDRRLGGTHSGSRSGGREKISLHYPCWESNPGRPVHNLVITLVPSLEFFWTRFGCRLRFHHVYYMSCQCTAPFNYPNSDSLVSIVTRQRDYDRGSITGRSWEFFSSQPRQERLWGLHSHLHNGYRVFFPWG